MGNEQPAKASKAHSVYLIRHGETVDNVAGIYAGVRDSPLTNHGVLQAARLGADFAQRSVRFTHVFSSNLIRAFKTAGVVRDAQSSSTNSDLAIVQLPELREQDFGFYEGKSIAKRSTDSASFAKEADRTLFAKDQDFQDVESKASMAQRADKFLDEQLLPLFHVTPADRRVVVAVVSHGIILGSLWRCLLRRQPSGTVTLADEVTANHSLTSLEHLGGWSNTGYLSIELRADPLSERRPEHNLVSPATEVSPTCYRLRVCAVNCKDHLRSLKRTRGIGSSKFDRNQQSIDAFFKKQRRQ